MTEKFYQQVAVVGTVDPDANATGSFNTDWIDMSQWQEVLFVIMAGIIASSGTIDFKVQEATSSTGAGAQTLASGTLNITQMTTGDNDEQTLVNVEAELLSTGYDYVRGVMTLTTAGSDSAVLALGRLGRYGPANAYDLASVGEIKG